MEQVELVMQSKTRPARHERVVTIADGVGGDVAEVRAGSGSRLLRHLDRFIPREEDKLWAVHRVRLDEIAIPGWVARTGSERRRAGDVVAGYGSGCTVAHGARIIGKIAVPLTKPTAIRSVLRHNLHVKALTKIELPHKTFPTKPLVVGSRTATDTAAVVEVGGRCLPHHGVDANPWNPDSAGT